MNSVGTGTINHQDVLLNKSIIKTISSESLHSLNDKLEEGKTTMLLQSLLGKVKTKALHCICSISFLLPVLLATIVIITFLIIFIVNYLIPANVAYEMSVHLTTVSIDRIQERLHVISTMPPKAVAVINDLQSHALLANDLQRYGRSALKKVKKNYPSLPTMSIVNNDTAEHIFFEQLPNGTIYEGFRLPNSFNDSNLYRYIVNNNTLDRIEGWGPVVVIKNYYIKDRPWYEQCKGKIDHWTKVLPYTTGQLALLRCTSFFTIPNNSSSKLLGFINSAFTLGNLNVFLKSFSVGKTGFTFIMERNGDLIASSIGKIEEGSVGNRVNVINSTVDSIKIIGNQVLKEHRSDGNIISSSTVIDVNGVPYFVKISGFHIHENINWIIVVAFPSSDYRNALNLGDIITIVLICSMILASICISAVLSCCIKRPLFNLRSLMKQVGFLKLDSILNDKKGKKLSFLFEIRSIQTVFYSMVCALQSFRKFVPEVIIRKSLQKKKVAEMYLVEREMSILFMDFVEFTKLTESLSPVKLIELIGEALEELTIIIEEEGGVIDKYIGDAIMALFNTPSPFPNFEEHACFAALRCIQKLKEKESDWNRRQLPSIKCRIGIHSGKALVGNFGSSKRLNFTSIGHSVNLAARLEPLCKLYKTTNLIGESTFEKAKDKLCFKFIDIVVVKGTSGAISIYSILNERNKANENELKVERICFKIKQYLEENNLAKVIKHINKALTVTGFTNDHALNVLLKRCVANINNSNGNHVTGILTLTEKNF